MASRLLHRMIPQRYSASSGTDLASSSALAATNRRIRHFANITFGFGLQQPLSPIPPLPNYPPEPDMSVPENHPPAAMASHEQTSLIIENIPGAITTLEIESKFAALEGYLHSQVMTYVVNETTCFNILLDFASAKDARAALSKYDHVILSIFICKVTLWDSNAPLPPNAFFGETRKPLQDEELSYQIQHLVATCYICQDKVAISSVSKPCRYCTRPQCLECLKRQFIYAINDREGMPVRCCQKIVHHQVAQHVLSKEEMETYKSRYEEMATRNPLYCPKATCSKFIPSRLWSSNKVVSTDKTVSLNCPACSTKICLKCKQMIDAGTAHRCSRVSEAAAIVKAFDYKTCPKCRTGVMRMFGCSHMQCLCGAQWCWDCRRPIFACHQRPCEERARVEGEDPVSFSEDEEESESDDDPIEAMDHSSAPNTDATTTQNETSIPHTEVPPSQDRSISAHTHIVPLREAVVGAEHPPVTEEGQNSARDTNPEAETSTDEQYINLDDPDRLAWETASYDFGDEPGRDGNIDDWGCQHYIRSLRVNKIHTGWIQNLVWSTKGFMPPNVPQIECMRCFKPAKFHSAPHPPSDKSKKAKTKPNTRFVDTTPNSNSDDEYGTEADQNDNDDLVQPGTLHVGEQSDEIDMPVVKKSIKTPKERLYNCRNCGLIICTTCKRLEEKQTAKEGRLRLS